jgi:L-gulono-1,4-lactone dehydrogenase
VTSATLWRNWAGDQRCAPLSVSEPADEAAVQAIVERALAVNQPLRAVGSGHSFTDAACTDGHMLRLDRFAGVGDVDTSRGLVQVGAGITLRELGVRLAERGLAMENLGDIDTQTLAGAIATATHGTGARFQNLSAQVAGLRLVTGTGDVIDLDSGSDADAYCAARVSFGSLGIVVAVTLRCVPLFTLHRVDEPRPLEDVLRNFDEVVDGNDHFEFFVFPYTTSALTRTTNRVDADPDPPPRWRRYLDDVVVQNRLFGLTCRIGKRAPAAIPFMVRRAGSIAGRSEVRDHSYRVFATRREVRFNEMEYAIPRENGPEAVRRVMALVQQRRLPISFPIEVRCVAGDDAFLSPAYQRETCYVAVHVYRGMEFETYFRAVEAIMNEYGGRPHWGKRHYQSAATLAQLYPRWQDFQAVRARLDPRNIFRNEYTDRVLGPVQQPRASQRKQRPSPR